MAAKQLQLSDVRRYNQEKERLLEKLQSSRLCELDKEIQNVMLNALEHPENMKEYAKISLELQTERQKLLKSFNMPEHIIFDKPLCEICNDTGHKDGKICVCVKNKAKQLQIQKLNAKLDLAGQSFDTFSFDFFTTSKIRDYMAQIYKSCFDYCEKFNSETSGNILFQGKPGTGKTFLSSCIAGAVSEKGFSVVYETAGHILSHYDYFGKSNEDANDITDSNLLIIDDLGTEYLSSYSASALLDLVNTRIFKKKPMLISTNLTKDEIKKRYSPPLESRLLGEFLLLEFQGEDLRQKNFT